MSTLVTVGLLVALFVICSVRTVTLDARSPREMAEVVRAYGWRSLIGVGRMVAVVLLLVLAGLLDACKVAALIGFGLLMSSAVRVETGRPQRQLEAA